MARRLAITQARGAAKRHDGGECVDQVCHLRPMGLRSAGGTMEQFSQPGRGRRTRLTWPRAHRALSPAPASQSRRLLFWTCLVKALIACVIGLAVGLWATAASLRSGRGFDAATIGAWTVSEKAGAPDADPYTRANLERSGEIPLAAGEGLQFIARTDDSGAALDPRCAYLVGHTTPPARYWTLSLIDRQGFPVENPAGALWLSLERNHAQRRRRFRHRGLGERSSRQLAADRRQGSLRSRAAPLRFAGQRDGGRDRQGRDAAHRQGKLPVNLKRAAIDLLMIALGAAMVAALVHIVAILIIPLYATRDAFARLSPLGPVNATIAAAAAEPAGAADSVRRSGRRQRLLPLRPQPTARCG